MQIDQLQASDEALNKRRQGPFGGIHGKHISDRFSGQEIVGSFAEIRNVPADFIFDVPSPVGLMDPSSFTSARNSTIFNLKNQ